MSNELTDLQDKCRALGVAVPTRLPSASDASASSGFHWLFPRNPEPEQTIAIHHHQLPNGKLGSLDVPEGWEWVAVSTHHVRFMYLGQNA